jgi:hypothetical protein
VEKPIVKLSKKKNVEPVNELKDVLHVYNVVLIDTTHTS